MVSPSDSFFYNAIHAGLLLDNSEMILESIQALCNRGHYDNPALVIAAAEELAHNDRLDNSLRLLVLFGQGSNHVKLQDLPNVIHKISQSSKGATIAIKTCFRALRHQQTHPNSVTLVFNLSCMGLIKSSDPQISDLLFRHIPIVNQYCAKNNEDPSHDLIVPNADTLGVIIENAVRIGNPQLAEHAYQELVPYIARFNHHSLGLLVHGLIRMEEFDRAKEWLAHEFAHYQINVEDMDENSVSFFKLLEGTVEKAVEEYNERKTRSMSSLGSLFPGQPQQ